MAEEKEHPLAREDVLRLIRENGGTPQGLDLSRKVFENNIDLHGLDLNNIVLMDAHLEGAKLWDVQLWNAHLERAKLQGAHLERADLRDARLKGADLRHAHLEGAVLPGAYLDGAMLGGAHLEGADLYQANFEGASLDGAHLEGADLSNAHLEGATLWIAHLEGADLSGANLKDAELGFAHLKGANLRKVAFFPDTELADVDWENYILREEILREFYYASETYRRLKQWYTYAGIYDVAGEFFFREMEAKRKGLRWRPQPWHRGWLNIHAFISGYGERPLRVIRWSAIWILGLAVIYYLIGATWSLSAVWNSLYFSVVSFTALGYGSWVSTTNEWIKGIGALESFMGVFTIALFLVTFTRRMRR